MTGRLAETKLDLALSDNGCLVWSDKTHRFGERSHAGRPAVENTDLQHGNRNLRDSKKTNHTDENEVAVGFLSNVFAQERALKVWEDARGFHIQNLRCHQTGGLRNSPCRRCRVAHQHGNGHRADASRIRRDLSRDRPHFFKGNVADKFRSRFGLGVRNAVDADVDHNGARFDHVFFD